MALVSIIIPTLNEEKGIENTIKMIPFDNIIKNGYEIELIVVDGNSEDNTVEFARRNGAKIILEKRRGYGRAYKTGFLKSKGDIIITMDADGTYPANKIPEYLLQFEKMKIDFMTINRFSNMEKGSMNLLHKIGNKVLSFILRMLYSIKIKDSQSGMWIMRKSFIDSIMLQSDGMPLSQEIKIIAFKYFNSIEIDGTYNKRLGDAKMSLVKDGFSNLFDLFKFKKKLSLCIIQNNNKSKMFT